MSGPGLTCSLHRYLDRRRGESGAGTPLWAELWAELPGRPAVGELVVGELLPVGQAGVNVVEDVEVPLASVGSIDRITGRIGAPNTEK